MPEQIKKKSFIYKDLVNSIEGFKENYSKDINEKNYFGFPTETILRAEKNLYNPKNPSIAYFSMEYGIAPSIYNTFQQKAALSEANKFYTHEVFSNNWLCDYIFKVEIDKLLDIPIYGGGLGVLAGDTMKSVADLDFSLVGIGILWNKGYFKQNFWYKHGQIPEELQWDPHSYPGLIPLKNIITLNTKEGPIYLRLWKYYVYSFDKKNVVPIILLDSNLLQNKEYFRKLTDQLYRSDNVWWKIIQRTILGVGGMKALESLGYATDRYHLNEGHAAFALVEKYMNLEDKSKFDETKKQFIFTCHTPVEAGHDKFEIHDVANVLEPEYVKAAEMLGKESPSSSQISLTYIALNNCSKVNAVAQKHGEVMRTQFPNFASKIQAITNGVHGYTWLSQSFYSLFEKYKKQLGPWDKDFTSLTSVLALASNKNFRKDLFQAHQQNKRNLIDIIKHWQLREDVFTISWARRIANYKRPALILHKIERLIKIAETIGPIQIILAGKAHPNDNIGGAHIDEILDQIDTLNQHKKLIKVLILENYDTYFGKLLTSSVDVWLNNPLPPFEASGTSGMKAIANGVLQLTTLDGWVVEAANDNIGWIFGYQHKEGTPIGDEGNLRLDSDSDALYDTLEQVVDLYYKTLKDDKVNIDSPWIDKMIQCIYRSAFFNTHRMVNEYNEKMWQIKK
ncbi:MAG: alpha-glucan family phosphorylase [Candidatus Omnitrophica bacterium]|nr:alpha-glucan family phosphorylase [Candidatus Omnitrophota bacterium]